MPTEILMPPLPNREDGRLARWFVSEGSRIAAGDVIAEVETETATLEIEASGEGRIERLLISAGSNIIPCGTPLALVGRSEGPEAVIPPPLQSATGTRQPLSFASAPFEASGPAAHTSNGHSRSAGQTAIIQTGREALRDALADALEHDANVVVIGTDVDRNAGAEAVTQGLTDRFGAHRIVSVPPLPQAYAGLAIGASLAGLKPIVCVEDWADALPVVTAIAELAGPAARRSGGTLDAPVVFRGPCIGEDSGSTIPAWLASIPGLKVVVPATSQEAYALLGAALGDGGPVAVLEPVGLYEMNGLVVQSRENEWPLSQARIVRTGRDVTVASYGPGVAEALAAAEAVAGEGLEAEVIDLVALAPIDAETVAASVARTGRLLCVEPGGGSDPFLSRVMSEVTQRAFASLVAAPARCSAAGIEQSAGHPIEEALRALMHSAPAQAGN